MHADDRFGPNDGKYVNVYNLANNLLKYDEQIIKKAREYFKDSYTFAIEYMSANKP